MDTTFYDRESTMYSKKRYEGVTETYNQFFFKKRLAIILDLIDFTTKNRKDLKLIEPGCADGVLVKSIDEKFPGIFSKMVGTDVSPKMIDEANRRNNKPYISFFNRGSEVFDKYDFVIEAGFLNNSLFDQEFSYVESVLKDDGHFICALASKKSLHTMIKLRGKEYTKTWLPFAEQEKILANRFEIINIIPYGLFIPKLWAFPAIARIIQPIFEYVGSHVAPNLFHEKIYLLKKKV